MVRFVIGVFLVTMPIVVISEDVSERVNNKNITLNQAATIMSAMKYWYNLECMIILNTDTSAYTSIHRKQRLVTWLRHLKSLVKIQILMLPLELFKKWQCNLQINILRDTDSEVKAAVSELSQLPGFARPLWLLFNQSGKNLEYYLTGVNIPFNVRFFVVTRRGATIAIEEVYRVKDGYPLHCDPYGVLTPDGDVELSPEPLWFRRNNLHGLVIPAVIRDHAPFTTVTRTENGIEVGGTTTLIWKHLEQSMNFTTDFVVQEDRSQGRRLPSGNWTGMIGKIKSGQVHIAVDTYSVNTLQRVGLNCTAELYKTVYRVYMSKPLTNQRLKWTDFLNPFDNKLWKALVAAMFILGISLAASYRLGRLWRTEKSGEYLYSLFDSFHCVFGAFCQQGHDQTPSSWTCRVVYSTIYITSMIVMSAYSASLIASLSNDGISLPFKELEGIIKDGRYAFGIENNSALHSYFMTQIGTTSIYGRLYDTVMKSNPLNYPPTIAAGVEAVCSRKFVFMATENDVAPYLKDAPCDIVVLPYKSIEIVMTFAIHPGSPYLGLINHKLLGMYESGVLRRNFATKMPVSITSSLWSSVTLDSVTPILVVLSTSVISSLLLLAVEKWGIPKAAQLTSTLCACARHWGTNRRRSERTRLARKARKGINVHKRNAWFNQYY